MAENSHISWTDNTHNEWIGCTKVSAGCDNCYAEREQDLRYGRARWGKGNARYRTSDANRRKPLRWEKEAITSGQRLKVFTASLSDVFDEEVPDEWRDELFNTIRVTPHLDWLVLTKRLAKMLRYARALHTVNLLPANVWWGCSVEDQDTFDQRVPELLKLRQWVGDAPLWLSVEPLLGPIDMDTVRHGADHDLPVYVDWVVVGGESGPAARPMHPDWARSLRDQCTAAGVAFHFKQYGEWYALGSNEKRVDFPASASEHVWSPNGGLPDGNLSVRIGKKASGRLLDGREWNEFPANPLTDAAEEKEEG